MSALTHGWMVVGPSGYLDEMEVQPVHIQRMQCTTANDGRQRFTADVDFYQWPSFAGRTMAIEASLLRPTPHAAYMASLSHCTLPREVDRVNAAWKRHLAKHPDVLSDDDAMEVSE